MKHEIKSFKLSVTWSDGATEGLASNLPEHLYDELQTSLRELQTSLREVEDLREEAYVFSDPANGRNVIKE